MTILDDRIQFYEQLGIFLDNLPGVALTEYRVGCLGNSSKDYSLWHQYTFKVGTRWKVFPAITMRGLAKKLKTMDLPDPTGVKSGIAIAHLGKSTPVLVQEIAYNPEFRGKFEVRARPHERLLEVIQIRTEQSFPTIDKSFFQLSPEEMPEELLDVWTRLNRHGQTWEEYMNS
jgi:hypothetical protein